MAKPTKAELIQWAKDAWRRMNSGWLSQYTLDKEVEDVYFSRHAIDLPEATENLIPVERKTSLGADLVQRIVSMSMSRPPVINIRLGSMNIQDTRLAEEAEDWVSTIWDRLRENFDIWLAQVTDMVLFGRGVSAVWYVPDVWGEWPERKEKESDDDYQQRVTDYTMHSGVPITWQHIPAAEFVPIKGDDEQIRGGIWFGYRYAMDIQRKYGKKAPILSGRLKDREITPWTKVQFITYADDKYVAYMVGDIEKYPDDEQSNDEPSVEVVNVFEHPMEMCPWVFMKGLQTSTTDPVLRYLSALYFVRNQIKDLDSTRSARATTLWNFTLFPPMVQELSSKTMGTPTGEDRETAKLEWKQGGSIVLWGDMGEKISWPEHPGVNAELDGEIALLQGEINRLGVAPQELADPSMSGVARNIALQISASKFGSYTSSMALGARQVVERFMTVGKHILTNPTAPRSLALYTDSFEAKNGFLKLTKEHVNKPFRIQVDITSPVKPDLLALIQAITAVRQGPDAFLPDEILYEEWMGMTDPQRIKDLLEKQKWERNPSLEQARQAEIARRFNLHLDATDLQDAMGGAVPPLGAIPPALQQVLSGQAPPSVPVPVAPPGQPMAGPLVPGRAEGQQQNQTWPNSTAGISI